MPTDRKNVAQNLLIPMALVPFDAHSGERVTDEALIKSLIACIGVYCEERGWTHSSYFLEKAQETVGLYTQV